MHTLEIITHGGGAILVDLYNAIARIRMSQLSDGIFLVPILAGQVLYMLKSVQEVDFRAIGKWVITWSLIFGLLYKPTSTVLISDRIVGGQVTVDNVPYGLAVFASFTSKMGASLAELFEDQLQIPNEVTRYTRTGTLMASKLAVASSELQIVTPHLERSFRNFGFQCLMYDVRIGARYTMDDLLYSEDVWTLIKENTSLLRMFEYFGRNGEREILVCREGAQRLEKDLNQEAGHAAKVLAWRFLNVNKKNGDTFSNTTTSRMNQLIRNYLPASHELLVRMSGDSTELIKKHLVMNAIRESAIKNAQVLDIGAGAQGYAIARAKLQQQNTFRLLGSMAGSGVQYLMNLFEALFYGSFLLILVVAMFPGGERVIFSYFTSLVWIQSWPLIYAIINFFATANSIAASNAAAHYVSSHGAEGIGWNLFTSPAIVQANIEQAALAGFYSLSVPFIAIGVVKGAGAFVHLAGSLTSISQGAASQAGEELTTGNYALENVQMGNTSAYNMNQNHWDTAPSYRAQSATFEISSGSQLSVMGDGSAVLNQGSALSSLATNLHLDSAYSNGISMIGQQLESAYQQAGRSYVENMGATMSSMMQMTHAGSKTASEGEHYSLSEQTSETQALQHFDQLSSKLAEQTGWSKEHAYQAMIGARLGLGLKGSSGNLFDGLGEHLEEQGGIAAKAAAIASRAAGALGVGAEGSAGTHWAATDRMSLEKVNDFIRSENATETIDQAIRATHDAHYNVGSDSQDRISQDYQAHFNDMKASEAQLSTARQNLHSFQHSQEYRQTEGANFHRNLNDEFVHWLKGQRDQDGTPLSMHAIDKLLLQDETKSKMYAEEFLREKFAHITSKIAPSAQVQQQSVTWDTELKEKGQAVQIHADKAQEKVTAQAKEQGLPDVEALQVQDHLKQQYEERAQNGQQQFNAHRHSIADKKEALDTRVSKKANLEEQL